MAIRVLQAIGELALHLPEVRRDPLAALDQLASPPRADELLDLPYGPHGGQRLDLYLPEDTADGQPGSAVLFFHGGRWSYGRKDEYRFVARSLVARGHAVAVCDYRKYP